MYQLCHHYTLVRSLLSRARRIVWCPFSRYLHLRRCAVTPSGVIDFKMHQLPLAAMIRHTRSRAMTCSCAASVARDFRVAMTRKNLSDHRCSVPATENRACQPASSCRCFRTTATAAAAAEAPSTEPRYDEMIFPVHGSSRLVDPVL